MDYFYEQFQTKDYKKIENMFKKIEILIVILGIISLIFLQIHLVILSLFIFIGIKVYKTNSIIEYEYELTSYDLSVNKIINKSKRKEIINFNIKNIVSIKDINTFNEKFINASLDDTKLNHKIIKVKSENGTINIKLGLDENLINIIKRINPISFY